MESSWTRKTLIGCLRDALLEHPERVSLETPGRRGAPSSTRTRAELWKESARLAHALSALGLKPGENVLFLSENSARWITLDLALLGMGSPGVPRGVEAPSEEIQFIVRKVRARIAIVQHARDVPRLAQSDDPLELVILMTGEVEDIPAPGPAARVVAYAELLSGEAADAEVVEWFDARVKERLGDEVATIVFTSGTTGEPKGVVLSQANLASNLLQTLAVIDFLTDAECFLSVLPPWHTFERIVEYALLSLGLRLVYTDRRHFASDIKAVTPDVLAAVPRLWVMLMDGVMAKAAKAPPMKRHLLFGSLWAGATWVKARRLWSGRHPRLTKADEGGAKRWRAVPGLMCWPLYMVARKLVLGKVAAALGLVNLRAGCGISGGGALPPHVDLFLESLGVRILNGYGLTETSPVLAIRLPRRNVVGTVGPPVPQTDIEIRDLETAAPLSAGEQGVIFARGPQIMQGYWDEPAATERVLDSRGWFDTGDLGRLTRRGELMITGRVKDTIVLLSGENIEPEPLENALTESTLIQQALVVGQDQKFLGALIVPDRESEKLSGLSGEELAATLKREVQDQVNSRRGFRSYERIVRFHVLEEPFSREDGSMSQTLKLKRNIIQDRHARAIGDLFGDAKA